MATLNDSVRRLIVRKIFRPDSWQPYEYYSVRFRRRAEM